MKKIMTVLLVSLAMPCVAMAVCCSSIVLGPTATAPEFIHKGCTGKTNKANYGGNASIKTDATYLYQTSVSEVVKLRQYAPGMDPVTVASKTATANCNCNATTVVAILTLTPTCSLTSGSQYYTEYSIITAPCTGSNGQTTTVSSDIVTCP